MYYKYDGIAFDSEIVRPALRVLLKNKSLGKAWFIQRDGRPVGYAVATFGFDHEFGGRMATVTDLYLEPRHRRKGLGRKTLEHVADFCRRAGVRGLELQAERDKTEARAFYKRCGFVATDRIPMNKRLWAD
ncbi:MAG TPA: GNAT family N-acetyltransferase [Verrucomicrobiae bacterium]|nr:GNAT family N-acetyltransferase [Verrucomicrobiae bacterium]